MDDTGCHSLERKFLPLGSKRSFYVIPHEPHKHLGWAKKRKRYKSVIVFSSLFMESNDLYCTVYNMMFGTHFCKIFLFVDI